LTRALTLAYATGCALGFNGRTAVIGTVAALALAALAALAMSVAGGREAVTAWRQRGAPAYTTTAAWWSAQTFSYALAAVCLVPAALWPRTVAAASLLAVCLALSLLSAFSSYCLGRFIYVVLFRPAAEEQRIA
jgi:hypothetical protein